MTLRGEEEVMLDWEKCNLWLLLILQVVQENEHKLSRLYPRLGGERGRVMGLRFFNRFSNIDGPISYI